MPLKWVFQHNKDPKHISKRTTSWLQTKKIDVMKWPVQCPDINPIENLWIDLKNSAFDAKPKTAEDLWSVVQSACSFCSQVSNVSGLHATQMQSSDQR